MSNNFRACCVNGLSNALYQKMKQTTSNNEFVTDACFQFLKYDETYGIKAQMKNYFMSDNFTVFNSMAYGKINILMPTELYDSDIDAWSENKTYTPFEITTGMEIIFEAEDGPMQPSRAITYGLIGSYVFKFEITIDYAAQSFLITEDPVWYKITFDDNESEAGPSTDAEVKRVNGLYNAFASSLNQMQNSDVMNSDAIFEYLANNETYNLRSQFENMIIDYNHFAGLFMLGSMGILLKFPVVEFDEENGRWFDQLTYSDVPVYFAVPDPMGVMMTGVADTNLIFGKYICDMNISLEAVGSSGGMSYEAEFQATVNSISWSKLAFDA